MIKTRTATFGTAAACMLFAFLWQQLQATRVGYSVGKAQQELKSQRDRNAYLRMELERLSSPERLESYARERLGMAPPTPESLVFLGSAVQRPDDSRMVSLLVR
ncbi:MAG TPA: septum formation initiator family protein [Elusimicrobiota bacterium]|jgi:cell division protein FtsL|nr:septum formation initiator family protein [Elusimicrobiota bacterium]